MDINNLDGNILIGESIYIVGHKKPDLDAVVSAYAYQIYRHSRGDFNYVGVRCDEINPVTQWAFKRFKTEIPMLIRDVSGKRIVLVDHTDPAQRPDGWEGAEIIEVMDHHNLKLETTIPPKITIRPYGSTSTLVAQKLIGTEVSIPQDLAGLLLAAILDDTLALRSPITTYVDRSVAGQLGAIAGIMDISSFARELFEHKDVWYKMRAEQIIDTDAKNVDTGTDVTVQISQVETMDYKKLEPKMDEIYRELIKRNKKEPKDIRMVMITDLLRNECIAIVAGDRVHDLEKIFSIEITNTYKLVLPGVMSRKKDVVPKVLQFYKINS